MIVPVLALAALVEALAQPVPSAPADAAPYRGESIRVTAQKREEWLADVPISIVVLPGEELRKRSALSLDDLPFLVPSLSIRQTGFNRTLELRGMSNITGNSALVGQYIDEAVVTATVGNAVNIGTYDLERVEVLRGPQGTLYGEGSAGGTIRFVTREPRLDRFAAASDLSVAFRRGGAPGHAANAMLNAPLVPGEAGLRFAGTFARDGGWIDQPAAGRKDINHQSLSDARLKALWKPGTRLSVNALAAAYRDDRGIGTQEDGDGNYTQAFRLTETPRVKLRHDLLHFAVTGDLDGARLLAAATWFKASSATRNDGFSDPLLGPGAEPFDFFTPATTAGSRSMSAELRLSSLGDGTWSWTAGAFFREDRRTVESFFYYAQPGPPGTPLPDPVDYRGRGEARSTSFFADASHRVTDRVKLGAGVRAYRDRQVDTDNFIAPAEQRARFDSVDPRAYVQWKAGEGVHAYASAAKGFRSGAFSGLGLPNAGPESVWSYEAGVKSSAWGGRLSLDAALFHADYKDYQAAAFSEAHGVVVYQNAGDARIRGIEWGLAWRPADEWSATLAGTYLTSRFTRIDSLAYVEGDPIDFVPKYQGVAAVERGFTWRGRRGFARVDYSQRGSSVLRNRSIGPWWYAESDVIRLLNLRAHLALTRNVAVSSFVRNVLDDRGFVLPPQSGVSPRNAPRTVGVELHATFD